MFRLLRRYWFGGSLDATARRRREIKRRAADSSLRETPTLRTLIDRLSRRARIQLSDMRSDSTHHLQQASTNLVFYPLEFVKLRRLYCIRELSMDYARI